jgi:hypothetical protein
MTWPFKDYDFYGERFVDMDSVDRETTQTECVICIEAENELYTKYAHPKAHIEAHTQASAIAETLAVKEKDTESYVDYYTFYYGREYKKIYKELYKKYKQEYSAIVLERPYDETTKICQYHRESIYYHTELK